MTRHNASIRIALPYGVQLDATRKSLTAWLWCNELLGELSIDNGWTCLYLPQAIADGGDKDEYRFADPAVAVEFKMRFG